MSLRYKPFGFRSPRSHLASVHGSIPKVLADAFSVCHARFDIGSVCRPGCQPPAEDCTREIVRWRACCATRSALQVCPVFCLTSGVHAKT